MKYCKGKAIVGLCVLVSTSEAFSLQANNRPRAQLSTNRNYGNYGRAMWGSPKDNLQTKASQPVYISSPNREESSSIETADLQGEEEEPGPSESPDHHRHGGKYSKAVHQFEHRAKEKNAIGAAERITEKATKSIGTSMEKAGERTAERVAERALDRVGEGSAERIAERASERALERVGERAVERVGERVGERAGERTAERVAERALDRVGEGSAERIAERASERALERVGERAVERVGERVGERALENMGERAAERGVMRLVKNGGEGLFKHISKGVTIAIPFIGAFFTLYLFKQDIERIKEEISAAKENAVLLCFVGAGIADFLDAMLHFVVVYGLAVNLSHHNIVKVERLSIRLAIVSTVLAIVGEIVSIKMRNRKKRMQSIAVVCRAPEMT